MTVVGGVVLFLIAQPLLLAVFSDQLSERVEREVLGTAQTVPFLTRRAAPWCTACSSSCSTGSRSWSGWG